jgi:hypothetical protein
VVRYVVVEVGGTVGTGGLTGTGTGTGIGTGTAGPATAGTGGKFKMKVIFPDVGLAGAWVVVV